MTNNLQKIIDKATDVLGDEAKALDWIDHVSATLGGTPRELSNTEEGTNKVLLHLANISRHSFT
jgi:uncharacterized protein (DUF2384 family)